MNINLVYNFQIQFKSNNLDHHMFIMKNGIVEAIKNPYARDGIERLDQLVNDEALLVPGEQEHQPDGKPLDRVTFPINGFR